ncbi:hypothetical protein EPUL_003522 [Erysiphe pulchra]|uniref:Uncharacterized protein n=1 Tax=Erysiphe pulchra TaxID=225359 RepID=A0A2S4PYS8_9PEZI|nr:hypothetical protein EPUL_003522 [Erysiphe pulchra]
MVDHYPSSGSNHLLSHFQPNVILRGAQLTIVGALRALQNPSFLTSQHYKQVAIAVACGIAIRIAIFLPLEPYFCRIRFTKAQKRNWFHDREGLLFGFGIGFYLLIRIPFLGVLIYGIAEASTAYLITKITDPPPPPDQSEGFAANQQHWTNKIDFLKLGFTEIDKQIQSEKTTHPLNLESTPSMHNSNPPPYQEFEDKQL